MVGADIGDAEALEQAKREQQTVSSQRQLALDRLGDAPDRIVPGGVRFLAHALVVPAADYAAAEVDRHDARVEEIAVNVAVAWEREHGGAVRDVSKPALARAAGLPDWPGFDMMSDRPGETRRHIEVKGRAGRSDVQMEDNEWKQANHLGDEYWLYVALDCATPNPVSSACATRSVRSWQASGSMPGTRFRRRTFWKRGWGLMNPNGKAANRDELDDERRHCGLVLPVVLHL